MPDLEHPVLLAEAVEAERQAAQPNEPAPEQTPSQEPVQTQEQGQEPPPPSEEDFYVKLDKRNLYADLRRLAEEDDAFARTGQEMFGRRAARRAEARIAELEAQQERLMREVRVRQIEEMTPEEVDYAYRNDSDFAQEYTDLLHSEPPDPELEAEGAYYANTAQDLFERGEGVLHPQRVQEYEAAFTYCPVHRTNDHSFYDHDETGTMFTSRFGETSVARKAAFDYFVTLYNRELSAAAQARRSASPVTQQVQQQAAPQAAAQGAAPQQEPQPGTPNARLIQNQPDTSSAISRPQDGRVKYTGEEVRQMDWETRIRLWPNPGDYERAVNAGEIQLEQA